MAYGGDRDVLIEKGEEEEDEELMQLMAEAEARRAAEAAARAAAADAPELPDGKTHHLFISHSEEDGEWAAELVDVLEREHGLKCLWPRRDFTPGREVAHMIQSGIAHTVKVLFILTEASLESGWCKYERNWAFVLSMEERENRIIPLLLRPCEVPNIFKTINYIDVPKGEDHIYRIIKAFDEDDGPMEIIPNVENLWNKQVNGLKRSLDVQKIQKKLCGQPYWCFPKLDEYQRYKLQKLGSKASDKVYSDVREIINHSGHMKRLGIRKSIIYWGSLCIFTVLAFTLGCLLILRIYEIASKNTDEPVMSYAMGLMFGLILLPILGTATCCFQKRNYRKVKEKVFKYSLETVAETSLLLKYEEGGLCHYAVSLEIMYYDIRPCVNFIRNELLRSPNYYEDETEEIRKEMAQDTAIGTVLNFIERNYDLLFTWDILSISEVNRHATFANKKCLCEMLERAYWFDRRI